MQQIKITRDVKNNKIVFENISTNKTTSYNNLAELIKNEFKHYLNKSNRCAIPLNRLMKEFDEMMLGTGICSLNFPGDLRSGVMDKNTLQPNSMIMYRD